MKPLPVHKLFKVSQLVLYTHAECFIGTPGTGKTLHSTLLAADSSVPMTHLNIGDIVKQKGFHEGYDETWGSYTVDEDRLLDYLEEVVNPVDGPARSGEFQSSLPFVILNKTYFISKILTALILST